MFRVPKNAFDSRAEFDEFSGTLSYAFPEDAVGALQGSAVEQGGQNFRRTAQGVRGPSDFDVGVASPSLFDKATDALNGFAKRDGPGKINRVRPVTATKLREASFNDLADAVETASQRAGHDVEITIFRDQTTLFNRNRESFPILGGPTGE